MCSPYFTGSLAIMLGLVTFNYWSVSTQNSDLVKEVQHMTKQMKICSDRIEDLEGSLKKCHLSSSKLKDESDIQSDGRKTAEKTIVNLTTWTENVKKETDIKTKQLIEEKKSIQDMLEKTKDKQAFMATKLSGFQTNLTICLSELASERSDNLIVPPAGLIKSAPAIDGGDLGPGQLPDVNPGAVNVVRKETIGGAVEHPGDVKYPGASSSSSKGPPIMAAPVLGAGISSSKSPVSSSKGPPVMAAPALEAGISSSRSPKNVDDVAGVMPEPPQGNNLDKAEDDSQIIENVNGADGKKDLSDDDQNPDGQIDETVDAEKQQFLVDKAVEASDGNSNTDLESGETDDNLEEMKKNLNADFENE